MADNHPLNDSNAKKPLAYKVFGWLKQLAFMLVLLTVFSAVLDVWRGRDVPKEQIPNIQALSIQGEPIDLKAMSQDEPVLLYFWGSWCPVCSFVSPSVNMAAKQYQVVTVAMTSGTDEKMLQYLQHKGYDFTVVNDPRGELSSEWSMQVTPTLLVIKQGKVAFYTSGFTSLPGIWWRMLLA